MTFLNIYGKLSGYVVKEWFNEVGGLGKALNTHRDCLVHLPGLTFNVFCKVFPAERCEALIHACHYKEGSLSGSEDDRSVVLKYKLFLLLFVVGVI